MKAKNIPEDKILYNDKKYFTYLVDKKKLILTYRGGKTIAEIRTFIYRPEHGDWISEQEFTYGTEVLQKGEKAKLFTAVPKIER